MPSSSNLENLAKIGQLKAEPPAQSEIDGLVASGRKRLKDAKNPVNALESRFDLAYSACLFAGGAASPRLPLAKPLQAELRLRRVGAGEGGAVPGVGEDGV